MAAPTQLDHLPRDAWVVVSESLSHADVARMASASSTLRAALTHGSLWAALARRRWPAATSWGACDWHQLYAAGHTAACQLSTQQPWVSCTPRPPASMTEREPPATAQLLLLPSSDDALGLLPPALVAAAEDARLSWWRLAPDTLAAAAADEAAGDGGSSACSGGAAPARVAAVAHSGPQHGHTAFVDAFVQLPNGDGPLWFASGSRDQTVKLWTPFASGSSSSGGGSSGGGSCGGLVRPQRTLRSHSGSITALLALAPTAGANGQQLLASGSGDKTIKLWSLASSSGGGGQQHAPRAGSGTRARQARAAAPQQAARNPLLLTLRGHSDAVTGLLRAPAGASSAALLASSSRDGRVKLWDVERQCCVATWRLPAPVRQLLDGLDLAGCVAAALPSAVQVLDLRAPPASAAAAAVLSVGWAGGGMTCAAAHGTTLAAGGRKGVRAFDVRAGGGSSSASSSSSRLLLSARMPSNEPVSSLHVDRVKLVAATRRVVLHSPGSIAVWSLLQPSAGARVQQLSSTLSPVILQRGAGAAAASAGALPASEASVLELIQLMSDADAEEAVTLLRQQQRAHAAQAGGHELQEQPAQPAQPQQQQAGHDQPDAQDSPSGSEHEASAGTPAGSDDDDDDASDQPGCSGTRAQGRIEPGVVTMAVKGPVICCVDTLGNILLRDFTRGNPVPHALQRQASGCSEAGSASVAGAGRPAGAGATAAKFWRGSIQV